MKVTSTGSGVGGGGGGGISVIPVMWVVQALTSSPSREPVATAAAIASGVPVPEATRANRVVPGGSGLTVCDVSRVSPISSDVVEHFVHR